MPRPDEHQGQPSIDWSQFTGLVAPTYTQTPDAVFDWIAPFLGCAELRVLLYITRRTFGFKKQSDAISIDQLCNGIVTREGRRLDYGTQLKRATVLAAIKGLREKNLILTHHQSDEAYGSRPTLYSLNITQETPEVFGTGIPAFVQRQAGGSPPIDSGSPPPQMGGSTPVDPGVHAGRPGGPELWAGRVQKTGRGGSITADPQETVIQQTDLQERDHSKTSNATSSAESTGDQLQTSTPQRIYSSRLSQMARDFSRELHDAEHERSNRTRALRMWAHSDLDEATFAEMMYEARTICKGKGNITRGATDGSPDGTKNRMPYFFSVLDGLLEDAVEDE